jgi:AraC-like DNA-binding protein
MSQAISAMRAVGRGSRGARLGHARYIHKLFESEGETFSEFMLACRLQFAHRLLTDGRLVGRPIASIAFDAGISDLSYFNRMFRGRYNATRTKVRAAAARRETALRKAPAVRTKLL